MNTLSNRRHPVLASVLAASLVVSLCAPPALAQSGRTHMAADEARRAPKDNGRTNLRSKEPAKPKPRESAQADRAKVAPAARAAPKSAPKSQIQARTPSAPAARTPAPARRDVRVNDRPAPARKARKPEGASSKAAANDRGGRDDDRRRAPARLPAAAVRPAPSPVPSHAGNVSGRAKWVSPAPSRHVVRAGVRDYHVIRGPRHYRRPIIVNRTIHVAPRRVRHYRNVTVVRPYGHWYGGYGHFVSDTDAWAFLALTAITLAIVDSLSESQQREHEAVQVLATTAPIGETIAWNDGTAAGSVTPLRDGRTEDGEYCREFLQTVTIGGREEEAYGTACLRPDGAWEVVSAGQ
ncbi:MAG: RT0821/Lpp0805 family surface protein [Alphaproteobacteria bacterium]